MQKAKVINPGLMMLTEDFIRRTLWRHKITVMSPDMEVLIHYVAWPLQHLINKAEETEDVKPKQKRSVRKPRTLPKPTPIR